MSLIDQRRAIRHLIDKTNPSDASADYYAFHHPDHKVQIISTPEGSTRARGYICLARTGMDLFRPVVTLRLPESIELGGIDLAASQDLIYSAFPPDMEFILTAPAVYRPFLSAFIKVQVEANLIVYVLDRGHFEPIINVLVVQTESPSGLPRFVIRETVGVNNDQTGSVLASAGLNWLSPKFAELNVHTNSANRRQGLGRSVVAYAVNFILDSGRVPLYMVSETNQASINLAESVGFVDIGIRKLMIEGTLTGRG